MVAERDTNDRYLAAYLADRVGNEFAGRISGIQRFGAFVRLDDTGADGLIPIRSVGREYFHYDGEAQTLMGSDTGLLLGIGDEVTVRLAEAEPVTGGLMLELLELRGKAMPRGAPAAGGRPGRGKAVRSKKKAAKTARKVRRTRR